MRYSKKKRSEIQSQMFIYIMTVILVGLIFLFGFKQFANLYEFFFIINAEEFRVNLENTFEDYKSHEKWGHVSLRVPNKVDTVCFMKPWNERFIMNPPICNSSDQDFDFIICDSWKDGAQHVFTIPNIFRQDVNLSKIEFPLDSDAYKKGYLCFSTQGVLEMTLTGLGDAVEISDR
jgi:hypothetical protein